MHETKHWKAFKKFHIFIPSLHLNVTKQETFPDVAEEWNSLNNQGPVVRMQVSANPRLNFNPGSFIFLSKKHSFR